VDLIILALEIDLPLTQQRRDEERLAINAQNRHEGNRHRQPGGATQRHRQRAPRQQQQRRRQIGQRHHHQHYPAAQY